MSDLLTLDQREAIRFGRLVLAAYDHGALDGNDELADMLLDIAETWCEQAGLPLWCLA